MAVAEIAAGPARVPGPPGLLPGRPDAVIDLQTDAGAALAGAQWRYADARVEAIDFVALGGPGAADPLGPGDVPNRTYDVLPHADAVDFDDSGWELLAPADTMRRLGNGRVCFNWYHSDGTLYFSDPPFGLPDAFEDPASELGFSGVFRVRDGSVTLVTDEVAGLNGVALSPDERYLYVGNWDLERKVVMRYALDADGHPAGPGELFFDMTGAPGEDAIDGIKVDPAGNLLVCGPGGILGRPEGERLGLLGLPEDAHNLAWGDDDGRTLYITALTSIYRMRTPA